jgi:hypothetical protein
MLMFLGVVVGIGRAYEKGAIVDRHSAGGLDFSVGFDWCL